MTNWIDIQPDTSSPYYPYAKVSAGASMSGIEELPYKLTRYLMDLPSAGYTPPSDNSFPRARLKKLLYWDGARPLQQALPTAEQIVSIQFDPENPAKPPDTERGYRIFSQELVSQSQTSAQSVLRIYLGNCQKVQGRDGYIYRQSVIFEVMVNYALESNMQVLGNSRKEAIAQAVIEAVDGVNFGGIGALTVNTISRYDDDQMNTGKKIYATIDWNGNN